MIPLSSLLSKFAAGRPFVVSALAHGVGIVAAVLWLGPGRALVRWNGSRGAFAPAAIHLPQATKPMLLPACEPPAVRAESCQIVRPLPEPQLPSDADQPWPELLPTSQAPSHAVLSRPVVVLDDREWSTTVQSHATSRIAVTVPDSPDPVLSPEPPPQSGSTAEPSPIGGDNPPPLYPFVAWRRGIEGTVVVELAIDPVGAVTAARLFASSGHAMLDQAALETLRTWRFVPARGPLGPQCSTYRKTVVFRIVDKH